MAKRVIRVNMEELSEGIFQETRESIVSRISYCTGFAAEVIKLMETGYKCGICISVAFTVMGKGFCTDFKDWDRAEAYDDLSMKEGNHA